MVDRLLQKCTLFLLLLFLAPLHAQIENEILAYSDSTELILNKGKKMMMKSLLTKDYSKASEIYYYLQEIAIKQGYLAFSYSDILYINLLSRNYVECLDYIKNYDIKIDLPIHQSDPQLTYQLYTLTQRNAKSIIQDAKIYTVEQQTIIKLFLYVVKQENLSNEYGHLKRQFQKDYPSSIYSSFTTKYLPEIPARESWNWSVGTSFISPVGNFGDNFYTNAVFYMGSDFNINRIYASLYLNAGHLSVETPFAINEKQFEKHDHLSYFDGGLQVGYQLYYNNWLHIAPYATLAGASLKSDIYSSIEHDNLEISILNTLAYGGGLHTMIKLYESETNAFYNYNMETYTPYPIKSYFALKFNIGYNLLNNSRYTSTNGNILYTQIGIVWGIGDF